jgi:hypothetical protein
VCWWQALVGGASGAEHRDPRLRTLLAECLTDAGGLEHVGNDATRAPYDEWPLQLACVVAASQQHAADLATKRARTSTDREAALGLARDATLAVVQGGPCTIQPTHTDQVKGTLPVVVGMRGVSCGG